MNGGTHPTEHPDECHYKRLDDVLRPTGVLGGVHAKYGLEARCKGCGILMGASVLIRGRNEIAFHWDEWLVHYWIMHVDAEEAVVEVSVRNRGREFDRE
jgi:hypothetical protein